MTNNDSRSSSCGLPPLAQDLAQDLGQDLAQDDESSSDSIDYSVKPGAIGQHGKPFICMSIMQIISSRGPLRHVASSEWTLSAMTSKTKSGGFSWGTFVPKTI